MSPIFMRSFHGRVIFLACILLLSMAWLCAAPTPCAAASGQSISQISTGNDFSVVLRSDDTLWSWGIGAAGQLGHSTTSTLSYPRQIGSDSDWQAVAAGGFHVLALKRDGTLWSWGGNLSGQLGQGISLVSPGRMHPFQVGSDSDWVAVYAGNNFSLAVKSDNSLWGWGENGSGQLGNGTNASVSVPMLLAQHNPWREIALRDTHVLAIGHDGSLWAWGANGQGQLGTGTTSASQQVPVQIGSDTDWLTVADGGLFESRHSLAIKNDGSLWAWGFNGDGQLGLGDRVNRVAPQRVGTGHDWRAVHAGGSHTVAVKGDGSLWAWGRNNHGQIGDDSNELRTAPVQVIVEGVEPPDRWTLGSVGYMHSLALAEDGSLWAWGRNHRGQLGKATVDGGQTNGSMLSVGTNNWVPWRVAASPIPSASNLWTSPALVTAPEDGAVNVSLSENTIIVRFDRPMRTDGASLGSIVIDNGAEVDVTAGTWSAGPSYGSVAGTVPNSVFRAPLVLQTPNTLHTARISGFIDAQLGQRGAMEMHPYEWVFTTEPRTLTEADFLLQKTLQMPEGTTVPAASFEFSMTPVQIRLNENRSSRPVDEVPAIEPAPRITLSPDRAVTVPADDLDVSTAGTTTVTGGFNLQELLEGLQYPGAGVYAWDLQEVAGSSGVALPAQMSYDQTRYQVVVIVDNQGEIALLELVLLQDTDTGTNSSSVDVDNANNADASDGFSLGEKVERALFTNTYTTPSTLEVTKMIPEDSEFANLGTLFEFSLTLTAHPLASIEYPISAHILDDRGNKVSGERGEFSIVAATTSFQLAHGERLVVVGLPAGTTCSATEARSDDFAPSLEVFSGGVLVHADGRLVGEELSSGRHFVSDSGRNAVDFVNAHSFSVPAGLAVPRAVHLGAVALLLTLLLIIAAAFYRWRRTIEVLAC